MAKPVLMSVIVLIALGSSVFLAQKVPQEFAPQEGSRLIIFND